MQKTETSRALSVATGSAESPDALTRFIITSALIYSHGQWSGDDVAKDMIRGAGITRAEINRITKDKAERRKLWAMLNQVNSPTSEKSE